jgi:hypothetical protein
VQQPPVADNFFPVFPFSGHGNTLSGERRN